MKNLSYYFIIGLTLVLLFIGCVKPEIHYFKTNNFIFTNNISVNNLTFNNLSEKHLTNIEYYISNIKIHYTNSIIDIKNNYKELNNYINIINECIANNHTNFDNYLDNFFVNTYEKIIEIYIITINSEVFSAITA